MQRSRLIRKTTTFTLSLMIILYMSFSTSASDYYFRPTDIAMVSGWNSELSFTVSNPNSRTVVLEVSVRETGVLYARNSPQIMPLQALPARIILKPGTSQIITVDYQNQTPASENHSYEIAVKQLPILYTKPSEKRPTNLMTVTQYYADIAVRDRNYDRQYALTDFEASILTPLED